MEKPKRRNENKILVHPNKQSRHCQRYKNLQTSQHSLEVTIIMVTSNIKLDVAAEWKTLMTKRLLKIDTTQIGPKKIEYSNAN